MITYIKLNVKRIYVELGSELEPDNYDLGETFEDFMANKWVPLTEDQVQFHTDNPTATVEEVFNMKLKEKPVYKRTLEDAKSSMMNLINNYANSEEVSSFILNGKHSWLIMEERANYKNSIDSAKLLGEEELTWVIGDQIVTLPIDTAERMLAAIQLYADGCSVVTKKHLLNVDSLESIEEVDEYDYISGYPEKLNFKTNDRS